MYFLVTAIKQFGILFLTLCLYYEIRYGARRTQKPGQHDTPRKSSPDRLAPTAGKRFD